MRYLIFKDDEQINVIESDEGFCQSWCGENGYTYQADPLPVPAPEPEPVSEVEQLRADVDFVAVMTGVTL